MEWVIAAITFTILYGLANVLHAVWDAGYWLVVAMFPFAIIGTAYAASPQDERDDFKQQLRQMFSWRRRR